MPTSTTRAYPRTYSYAYLTVSTTAAVAGTVAVSPAGSVTFLGSATRPVSATVSAAGSVTFLGSATRPVTATVSAAGSVTFVGQATQPVTATVGAAGSVAYLGSASRAVTATVSAAGSVTQVGGSGAAVAISAAVAAAGFSVLGGDASLSVTAAVSATGYASGGASVISGGAMPWTFFADYAVAPFADIGPVQVVAFTADWQLSGFGSGEATIAISSDSALPRSLLMQLWTWRLWCFYQGVPVWAGCPTGVVDQGNQTVTVALAELPGYLAVKQYALNHTYSGVEQCTIAADLA